jgi:hypothetical protein
MTFSPFKFFRNPPPTVPAPSVIPSNVSSASAAGSSTNTSRATALISDLGNLAGTASYLQSVILSLTQGLGVTVNANTNPGLAQALSSIYSDLPPAISVAMYSNLLDVEFGAQQVLLAAGTNSTVQPNPFQNQAVITVNKAVEAALSDDASFKSQTALLLRSLKTQSAVYTQWQAQLANYPAAGTPSNSTAPDQIQASTIDVGNATNDALTGHVNQMVGTYASVFNMLASVSSVSQDIVCMVNSFATLGKVELAQIKSLFNLVKSTDVKEGVQDVANSLTSFVFVQMMSEASAMVFQLDRIAQMAIHPLASMTNPVGSGVSAVQSQAAAKLIGVIRATTQEARLSTGPLAGLIATNTAATACGTSANPAVSVGPSPGCTAPSGAGLSVGMNDLSTLLDWGLMKANKKVDSSLASFSKLMSRMQSDTCGQVKLLTVVNNLETLASLSDAFLTQQQNNAAAVNGVAPLLSTVGTILASTSTGNGATYTVQNGTVTVTPPSIPAPTAPATAILSRAGVQTSLAGISQSL